MSGCNSGRPHGKKANLDYRVIIPRLEAGARLIDLAREYGVSDSGLSKTARAKGFAGCFATPGWKRYAAQSSPSKASASLAASGENQTPPFLEE